MRGEVKVFENGQACQRCAGRRWCKPDFTQQEVQISAEYLLSKILEKFYNVPRIVVEGRSECQPRKAPHDTANCQGCARGVCEYLPFAHSTEDFHLPRTAPDRSMWQSVPKGPILWVLVANSSVVQLCGPGLQKSTEASVGKGKGKGKGKGTGRPKCAGKVQGKGKGKDKDKDKDKTTSIPVDVHKKRGKTF